MVMIQTAFVMIRILYIHWFHLFSEGTAVNCDKLGDGKRFNEMTEGEAKGGGERGSGGHKCGERASRWMIIGHLVQMEQNTYYKK